MDIDAIVNRIIAQDAGDIEALYKDYYSFVQQPPPAVIKVQASPFRIFRAANLAGQMAVCNSRIEVPAKTFVRLSRRRPSLPLDESKEQQSLELDSGSKFIPFGILDEYQRLKRKDQVFGQNKEGWKLFNTKVEVQRKKPRVQIKERARSVVQVRAPTPERSREEKQQRTIHTKLSASPTSKGNKWIVKLPMLNESSKGSTHFDELKFKGMGSHTKIKRSITQKDKSPKLNYDVRKASASIERSGRPASKNRTSVLAASITRKPEAEHPLSQNTIGTGHSHSFFKRFKKQANGRPAIIGNSDEGVKPNPEGIAKIRQLLNINGDEHTELVRNKILEDIELDLCQLGNVGKIRSLVQRNSRRKLTIGETPLEIDMKQESVNHKMTNLLGDNKEIENILQRVIQKMEAMGIDVEEEEFGQKFLKEREQLRKKQDTYHKGDVSIAEFSYTYQFDSSHSLQNDLN